MGLAIADKGHSTAKKLAAGILPAGALVLGLFFSVAASAAAPIVQTTNFNTHSGADYKGVNVGFKVTSDEELESVEVSLLSDGETLVTNTATDYLLDSYVLNSTTEFSTPFITFYGSYDTSDPNWIFGDWVSSDKPDEAKIMVNGVTVSNETFTEPNGWTFESLSPDLHGENFNTHAGADYQGVNVGFHAEGFEAFESVEVSLYDAGGNLLVTNTGTQKLADLYAAGENKFSTPFMTWNGTYGEEIYWNLGEWSSFTEPLYALVTVNGETVRLDNLTGPEFDSLKFDNSFIALTKEACKNGGWSALDFKNQGQCVAAAVSSSNSKHNR